MSWRSDDLSMKLLVLLLFLRLFSPSVADHAADENSYFMYADFWCAWPSQETSQVEYLVDWYFNKEFVMQYNSTVGKWTGHSRAGLITAALFNEDKYDIQQRKAERELICVNNADVRSKIVQENMAEPNVTLVEITSTDHGVMLVCSAYDFFPKDVRMSWHQNGEEVTTGVSFSGALTNGDWTYQAHTYLELVPGQSDAGIRCVVEHPSLRKPVIHEWDTSLTQSDRNFLIGGVSALLFGAVFLSVGLIQYKRRSCDPQFANPL